MAARLTILLTLVSTTAMAAATLDGPLEAMPGAYTVRLKSQTARSSAVTVRPKESTSVSL
jgi:hypothetical protein